MNSDIPDAAAPLAASEPSSTARADAPNAESSPAPRRRPKFWQLSLRTLLLVTAAVAAWTMVGRQSAELARLRERVAALQMLARELVVADFTQFAAIKLEETWHDENVWDLHVPQRSQGPYRLCLATRDIATRDIATSSEGRADGPVMAETLLPAGRHRVRIEPMRVGDVWRIDVQVDDHVVLSYDETAEWSGSGALTYGAFSVTSQAPPDRPFVLLHRRHYERRPDGSSRVPEGPGHGMLLWIDPREK